MPRLDRRHSVLVVVDVQERLLPVIHDADATARNIERLIRGAQILGIPVIVTEQYTKGLGITVEPLRNALGEGYRPIEKECFSAYGCAPFKAQLTALERRQILLAGVETHVCVYQTAGDLIGAGYGVHLIADAVSSRTSENRELAIRRLASDGVKLSSTEMALFELTRVSGTDEFRAISRLIK